MLSNRPLYANRADSRWYVVRDEARQFRDAIRRGQNSLLIGDAGSGKTTILHMLELELREQDESVCFVSLAQADDVGQAAVALVRAALEQHLLEEVDEDLVAAALDPSDPFGANTLLRQFESVGHGVFLLDDVSAEVGHALFGRLRDELWQLPLVWGVAVDSEQASGLLRPPADAFFEQRVRLRPLEPDTRRELLERRGAAGADGLTAAQISRLAGEGPGNPRQLVTYAREVAEGSVEPQELMRGADRRREMAELVGGRPAAMLVAELEGLGPVSAGDERLLDRLGWTRPRAVDLLGKLEGAGIVESHRERRDGPGRPRKLYELRPPSDFTQR